MSLKGFYKENVKRDVKLHEVVISEDFKDENGNPAVWKLKALKQTKIMDLTDKYLEVVVDIDKNTITKGKMSLFTLDQMAKSVVYPPLMDAGLQDAYGVPRPDLTAKGMSPEMQLLDEMLDDEAFNVLFKEVNDLNGNVKSIDKMVKEVKN